MLRLALTIVFVLLAPGAVAGCGGDDEPEAPPLPDLTVPRDTSSLPDATATTETAEPPATTEAAPPPPTVTETAPDGPDNDTPPPADTPAERFEEFCNENPGACD